LVAPRVRPVRQIVRPSDSEDALDQGLRHARHVDLASASWAAVSAWWSARASRVFLLYFGILYFLDGLLGLATGSGYLDLGILVYGVQDLPFGFKILANLPHLFLGGAAIVASRIFGHEAE
jgi:hypothetical protein